MTLPEKVKLISLFVHFPVVMTLPPDTALITGLESEPTTVSFATRVFMVYSGVPSSAVAMHQ